MASSHGKDGVVYVGANAVAEVTDWTYTETISREEDTAKGDTTRSYKDGFKDGSGSITGHLDLTDTNGQMTLRTGQSVTLHLYPDGNSPGNTEFTGSVDITGIDLSSPLQGINQGRFDFQGVLTESEIT